MNSQNKVFALSVTAIIFASCASIGPLFKPEVRPITIRVVDAETKKPLKDILVYYYVETQRVRDNSPVCFPFVDNMSPYIRIKESFRTNENGVVQIRNMRYENDWFEVLYNESIGINLDLLDRYKKEGESNVAAFRRYFNIISDYTADKIFNPNAVYKGFVIYSNKAEFDDFRPRITTQKKFRVLWNTKGLLNEQEEFTVELERWPPAESPTKMEK